MSWLVGLAVLDFEASALPPAKTYPVECAVGLADTGEVREWLIRPEPEWLDRWDWHYEAEQLHGLTRERLLREGRPREEVARGVLEILQGREALSDAKTFEQLWLYLLVGHYPGLRVGSFRDKVREIAGGDAALIERAQAHARLYAPRTHRAGDDVRHMLSVLKQVATGTAAAPSGCRRDDIEALVQLADDELTIETLAVRDPEIMSGTACYRGTRIPVASIAAMIEAGDSVDNLLRHYPRLPRRQIELAPEWVARYGRDPAPEPRWKQKARLVRTSRIPTRKL